MPSTTERSQIGPRLSLRGKVPLCQAGRNRAVVPGETAAFAAGVAPPPREAGPAVR